MGIFSVLPALVSCSLTECSHKILKSDTNWQSTDIICKSLLLNWPECFQKSKIIKYDQHRSLINISSMHQSLPLIHPSIHPSFSVYQRMRQVVEINKEIKHRGEERRLCVGLRVSLAVTPPDNGWSLYRL